MQLTTEGRSRERRRDSGRIRSLPLPFLDFASDESLVWRIASGAYLVAVVTYVVFRRARPSSPAAANVLTGPFVSLLPFSVPACLLNVFGFAGPHAFSLYLLSLVVGLVTAGLLFLSVAATLLSDDPE